MRRKKRLSGAPLVMRSRGENTDAIILDEIVRKPGSTVSEIAGRLDWTNGRVDGSVNRLESKNKVLIKHVLWRGMLVKRVYPAECPEKPHNLIHISKEMIDSDIWQDKAIVYMISRSTIGISSTEVQGWEKKALFKVHVFIKKDDENVTMELPERFSNFYQLENSDISLSAIGNLVLVTVESVLPVRLPSIYPEETKYKTTRYTMRLDFEKTEEVSSFNPYETVTLHEGKAESIPFQLEFLQAYYNLFKEKTAPKTISSEAEERRTIKVQAKVI